MLVEVPLIPNLATGVKIKAKFSWLDPNRKFTMPISTSILFQRAAIGPYHLVTLSTLVFISMKQLEQYILIGFRLKKVK